jgi:hypothetical protein
MWTVPQSLVLSAIASLEPLAGEVPEGCILSVGVLAPPAMSAKREQILIAYQDREAFASAARLRASRPRSQKIPYQI